MCGLVRVCVRVCKYVSVSASVCGCEYARAHLRVSVREIMCECVNVCFRVYVWVVCEGMNMCARK